MFLGVARSTWQAMEKRGDLPTHRLPQLGGSVRYCGVRLREFGTPADTRKRLRAATAA